MANKPTEVLAGVVELLSPLASEERQRVIQAALMLLGDTPTTARKKEEGSKTDDVGDGDWPLKTRTWVKQNNLTPEMIEQVFHRRDGAFEIIVEPPGKSQREKTLSAYILTGLSTFLASGETAFDDKSARDFCIASGCYSGTNHATYLKDRGNDFAGSRDGGWSLTSPGLKHAAALVKELSRSND